MGNLARRWGLAGGAAGISLRGDMRRRLFCEQDISVECLARFRSTEDMVAAKKVEDMLLSRMEELKLTVERSKAARYQGHVPPKWLEAAAQVLAEADEAAQSLQQTVSGEAPFSGETKAAAQEAQKNVLLQAARLRNLLAEALLRP